MPHGESELVCRRKADTPTPLLRPTPVCPAPPAEAAPPALSMGGTGPSPPRASPSSQDMRTLPFARIHPVRRGPF